MNQIEFVGSSTRTTPGTANVIRPLSISVVVFSTLILLAAGYYWHSLGSLAAFAGWIRGDSLLLLPARLDLGTRNAGDHFEAPVFAQNLTAVSWRVLGGTSSCACISTGGYPAEIPPWGKIELRVSGDVLTRDTDRFEHHGAFFVASDIGRRELRFGVRAKVNAVDKVR